MSELGRKLIAGLTSLRDALRLAKASDTKEQWMNWKEREAVVDQIVELFDAPARYTIRIRDGADKVHVVRCYALRSDLDGIATRFAIETGLDGEPKASVWARSEVKIDAGSKSLSHVETYVGGLVWKGSKFERVGGWPPDRVSAPVVFASFDVQSLRNDFVVGVDVSKPTYRNFVLGHNGVGMSDRDYFVLKKNYEIRLKSSRDKSARVIRRRFCDLGSVAEQADQLAAACGFNAADKLEANVWRVRKNILGLTDHGDDSLYWVGKLKWVDGNAKWVSGGPVDESGSGNKCKLQFQAETHFGVPNANGDVFPGGVVLTEKQEPVAPKPKTDKQATPAPQRAGTKDDGSDGTSGLSDDIGKLDKLIAERVANEAEIKATLNKIGGVVGGAAVAIVNGVAI